MLNQIALNIQDEVKRKMGHGQLDQSGVNVVFLLIGEGSQG